MRWNKPTKTVPMAIRLWKEGKRGNTFGVQQTYNGYLHTQWNGFNGETMCIVVVSLNCEHSQC